MTKKLGVEEWKERRENLSHKHNDQIPKKEAWIDNPKVMLMY